MATTTSTSPRSCGDRLLLTRTVAEVHQHLRCTDRRDGDLHLDHVEPDVMVVRRRHLVPLPWTQLDEVHGTRVVVVDHPGQHDRAIGDAAVTTLTDAVLCVWVGDCAPVALFSDAGGIGVAHAGWRGLIDGVLESAVEALRAIAPGTIRAALGPSIHSCCYEFSPADLTSFVARWGDGVAATTSDGRPALDVPAAVRRSLADLGVELDQVGECTGCHADRYWSHRARREVGRQAMVVWQTAATARVPA